MATQYKFYLKKDYDQFRNRIIATNSISFKICDYTLAENEQMFIELKEINDTDEDKVYVQMRKNNVGNNNDNIYIADILCNKLETYEFRIFTKMPDSDEILEQSAINTFKYEGMIFNEELIENTSQWGVIQRTLHRLENLDENIGDMLVKQMEAVGFVKKLDDFIEKNQQQVDIIQADVRTVISQLSTILDDFIDEGDM